jgi:hypothetical protein
MSTSVISRPLTKKRTEIKPVGALTNEAIEDAKGELEKQKTDLKKKNK